MTVTKRRKVNRLRKLKITRIDTVDKGAQPDAFIVLAKRDGVSEPIFHSVRDAVRIARGVTTETNIMRASLAEEEALWKREAERLRKDTPMTETDILPETVEEFEDALAAAVEETVRLLSGEDDLDEIEKADGPIAAFERLIAAELEDGAPTHEVAVLKAARLDPGLADRARSELPPVRAGLRDPLRADAERRERLSKAQEAEQGDEEPHVRSDRWRAEEVDQIAAREELERRAAAMVRESAATSKPLTRQQALLLVARADPELYGRSRDYRGSRYES